MIKRHETVAFSPILLPQLYYKKNNMSNPQLDYTEFVRKLFNRSGDLSKDFTHAVLGIVTESHEYFNAVDAVNGVEELGDLEFYLEALAQVVTDACGERPEFSDQGLEMIRVLLEACESKGTAQTLSEAVNELLDDAKRWVGYGKAPEQLPSVWCGVAALVYVVNIRGPYPNEDRKHLKAKNIAKLLKRYPGGEFSQYHALVRDLEAEHAELERS